jgi:hypothetical protein
MSVMVFDGMTLSMAVLRRQVLRTAAKRFGDRNAGAFNDEEGLVSDDPPHRYGGSGAFAKKVRTPIERLSGMDARRAGNFHEPGHFRVGHLRKVFIGLAHGPKSFRRIENHHFVNLALEFVMGR